jgi:hypothetical protein
MNTQQALTGNSQITTDDELTPAEDLIVELKHQAEWRRGKAEQYPEHHDINLKAAAELERLTESVADIPSDLLHQYDLLANDDDVSIDFHNGVYKQVGFSHRYSFENATAFIKHYIKQYELQLKQ